MTWPFKQDPQHQKHTLCDTEYIWATMAEKRSEAIWNSIRLTLLMPKASHFL